MGPILLLHMGIVIFFVGPGASELDATVFGSLLAEVKQVSIDVGVDTAQGERQSRRRWAGDRGESFTPRHENPALSVARQERFPLSLYADGFKKAEQQSLVDKLQSVPVMTLTQADIEKLRLEDRPLVEQMVEKTQRGFEQLLQALDPQRYILGPEPISKISWRRSPLSSSTGWQTAKSFR